MTSISFEAVAENGTIRIPEEYAKQIGPSVRVVVLPVKAVPDRKSDRIPFFGFDTAGHRFDRDEANAR
ncbi:MAG: hypothetical protein FWG23_08370 [Eggerthellaceae bacterium]|nr:hypothetical protein [Eggerthellaceae bacterium]